MSTNENTPGNESLKKKILIPIAVFVACCIGSFVIVATAPSVEHVEPERAISVVRTLRAAPAAVRLTVRSQGTVAPRTESGLVPEVSGRVVWVSPALVSGGFFTVDEPLLRIDPLDYEMALARAKAARLRAKSELDYATSELERQRGLSERSVASAAQLNAAQRAAQVAEAGLAEARVGLEQAERDLARTEIRAPYQGRVRSEQVDVGQFAARGATVAMLYATDYAEIRLPIPDGQLAYLELPGLHDIPVGDGPKVRLLAQFAGRRHEWEGRIVRTEGEIDPRSRMVHVVARVENPYSAGDDATQDGDSNGLAADSVAVRPPLAVGLFVKAEIEGPLVEDVIVVPRYAMRDDSHLLVVDDDDRLHTREVEVLRIDRDDVLIRGALERGERICISPLQVVVEGMAVRPLADDAAEELGANS
ncbi:MAG: efflux RND transporter periplasmic adaptor subunit [bacterium]|nr:efflux RND transporter periplasmic adaptor subunit [bacterium]